MPRILFKLLGIPFGLDTFCISEKTKEADILGEGLNHLIILGRSKGSGEFGPFVNVVVLSDVMGRNPWNNSFRSGPH